MATAYQIDLSFDLDEVLDMNLGHHQLTQSESKDESVTITASNALISSLPTAAAAAAASHGACSVCMEDFDSGKQLPCGHVFHAACITSWLVLCNSCPLCRSPCIRQ